MSSPGRGRGRQNNGLDALLWAPLRDVDPRVGEHLLDVLREAGIAAYLEPTADVGPYTRTVFLPSPPTDRLFVDRARRGEARSLVDQHGDEDSAPRVPDPARVRRDLDEAAEWARIVAAYEAENGPLVLEPEQPSARPGAPPPDHPSAFQGDRRPAEPPPAVTPVVPTEFHPVDPSDEHYEPPPPPPLPVPSPASLYSVLLVILGAVLVWAPGVIGLSDDIGLVLGSVAVASGVAMLVSRMRERSVDDGDDGAVV